jgi:hypothetical protein
LGAVNFAAGVAGAFLGAAAAGAINAVAGAVGAGSPNNQVAFLAKAASIPNSVLNIGTANYMGRQFKYPADREDDVDRKVQTTGHILEWLVGSLEQDQLYQSRVVSAVEFLSAALLREPSREWKLGPLGHALHALTIYQERAWGTVLTGGIAAFNGPMKAAPAAAVATQPEGSSQRGKRR